MSVRQTTLVAVAAFMFMSACTPNSEPAPRTEALTENASTMPIELTRTGACGEAFFWAESAHRNIAVTVEVTYSRPARVDVTLAIPFTLPDRQVIVRVLTGQNLSRNFCTDLPDMSSAPESTSTAIVGQGQATIAPPPSHGIACGRTLGTLRLRDLVAEDGTEFSPITVQSRDIACYAG